jgi:hypothetical protein
MLQGILNNMPGKLLICSWEDLRSVLGRRGMIPGSNVVPRTVGNVPRSSGSCSYDAWAGLSLLKGKSQPFWKAAAVVSRLRNHRREAKYLKVCHIRGNVTILTTQSVHAPTEFVVPSPLRKRKMSATLALFRSEPATNRY